jgi:hypothetical protein
VVRLRLLRSAPLSGPWGDRGDAPATNTSDLRMDVIAEQVMILRSTMLFLYSPRCVERVFSEDEMRRPTPYAVPLGLQMCSTGTYAQMEGGSAHHGY